MEIKKYIDAIKKELTQSPKKIAVAGADNETILQCIRKFKDEKIADAILIGDETKIKDTSKKISIDISDLEILNTSSDTESAKIASKLVHENKYDIFAKGSIETSIMMKSVLDKEYGLRTDKNISLVSVFETGIEQKNKLIFITDPGIRPYPNLEQKIALINNAVIVANAFGYKNPKVAIITAIEEVNPKMKETVEADLLSKMNDEGKIKNCIVDGPLSIDLAIDENATRLKHIENRKIKGDADILIFHDIHAANIAYKIFTHLLKWRTGNVLVGTSKPCIVTSRADTSDVKYLSILCSIIYHEYLEKKINEK